MGYHFQTLDTKEGHCPIINLELDDQGKAITTFMIDLVACRAAIELLSSKTGIPIRDLIIRDDGSLDYAGSERETLEDVFTDCLSLCEFTLNRITPHSDKVIRGLMVHVRFSLAHILKVEPSDRYVRCVKGRVRNISSFTFTMGSDDEFRDISHITYDKKKFSDEMRLAVGSYSYAMIEDALSLRTVCERYYMSLLSETSGREPVFRVSVPEETQLLDDIGADGVASLSEIISRLWSICSSVPPLKYHEDRGLTDMQNNRECGDGPAMARVRDRRSGLESSMKKISDVCRRNKESVMNVMKYARLLEAVMSGATVRKKDITLAFRDESILRLLDPDIFGRGYSTPPLLFIDCDALKADYTKIIDRFHNPAGVCWISSNAASAVKCQWKYAKRQNAATRIEGALCFIYRPDAFTVDRILRLKPKGQEEETAEVGESPLKDLHSPAILVSYPQDTFRILSGLSDPIRREHAKHVRMIVEFDEGLKGHTPLVVSNQNSAYIPVVTISDLKELFTIHTECVLSKVRLAVSEIQKQLEGFRPRNGPEERAVSLIRGCCNIALDDVTVAEMRLSDS